MRIAHVLEELNTDSVAVCQILIALPPNNLRYCIKHYFNHSDKYSLVTFLEQLNDHHPLVLAECMLCLPTLFQPLNTGKEVQRFLANNRLSINLDVFFKTLIHVINRREKSPMRKIDSDYRQPEWIYEKTLLSAAAVRPITTQKITTLIFFIF